MGIFSGIRNVLGIQKDRLDIQKSKLKVRKLKKEESEKDFQIQKANLRDVIKYDKKTQEIIRSASDHIKITVNIGAIRISRGKFQASFIKALWVLNVIGFLAILYYFLG